MPRITGIKTAAGVELQEVWDYDGTVSAETDPSLIPLVQHYRHFDLTDEELGRTRRYNCWGFTFLPRRYWINSSDDVDQILNDNCVPVAPGSLRPGDVIRYRDSCDVTTHTGRVWKVNNAGNCVTVRSKWGPSAEYVHAPDHPYIFTDEEYGTNLAYFRQVAPLKGIGDLWIRDANNDTGEQYSLSLWASPDILVDAPPYGSSNENPVFGAVNRIWAMVHNRSDADIAAVRVRYYWADPHAGFAPSNWQLIPGTAGHPNPTNTFTVPANSSVQAPYIEWTPAPVPGVANPAHQCLLAIAFYNDDPTDSDNPNPLVYPFSIRWENNIAARNVHVIYVAAGSFAQLDLATAVPFDGVEFIDVTMRLRLAYVPRLPVFGFPSRVVCPHVAVALGEQYAFDLDPAEEVEPLGRIWGPTAKQRDHDFELTKPREGMLFLPRMTEKTVAWRQIKGLALATGKPVPVRLEITAPRNSRVGSNFHLTVEQEVEGEVTGCYTVVVSIV